MLGRFVRFLGPICGPLCSVVALVGVGCEGTIEGPGGFPRDNPSSGAGTGGTSGDSGRQVANPTLYMIAAKYFPGEAAVDPSKRMFRLTRTQLDITTKTLLPSHYTATAVATLPRDPLQTNYEYSDNLSFNPANFTPYTNWVTQIATSVRATPESVIACASSGNSPACLADQAKRFVGVAFRGATSDADLARYADFFAQSVASVGLANATADLADLAPC
jgi:hypothetical protein